MQAYSYYKEFLAVIGYGISKTIVSITDEQFASPYEASSGFPKLASKPTSSLIYAELIIQLSQNDSCYSAAVTTVLLIWLFLLYIWPPHRWQSIVFGR